MGVSDLPYTFPMWVEQVVGYFRILTLILGLGDLDWMVHKQIPSMLLKEIGPKEILVEWR